MEFRQHRGGIYKHRWDCSEPEMIKIDVRGGDESDSFPVDLPIRPSQGMMREAVLERYILYILILLL